MHEPKDFKVYCPYFKGYVYFDHRGFKHLRQKQKGTLRPIEEYNLRLELLNLAKILLSKSKIPQGISYINSSGQRFYTTENPPLYTNQAYYEFIGHIEGNRIKVIVRCTANGEKFFWSVMPFWQKKTPQHPGA